MAGAGGQLEEALGQLGKTLADRETTHGEGLEAARATAAVLHARVASALDRYHSAVEAGGAPQLRVELTPPRIDEKHVRSYEFDLRRGRHRGLFVLKSRGELTLVGPFRTGKTEGPCRSFPLEPGGLGAAGETPSEIDAALIEFISSFLEEAATP